MLKLKAAVTQLNLERPAGDQFTDEQCRIKFLSLIDTPQSLVDKAIEEMQRGSYRNAAGIVTLGETVAGFDELWRVNFARGAIKFAAPPQQGGRDTNRVDAMLLNAAYECATDDEEEPHLYALAANGERVSVCWQCSGAGHVKRECPSKRKFPPAEVIKILQDLTSAQSAKYPQSRTNWQPSPGSQSSTNSAEARRRFLARRGGRNRPLQQGNRGGGSWQKYQEMARSTIASLVAI
jgi:hypothetical protein